MHVRRSVLMDMLCSLLDLMALMIIKSRMLVKTRHGAKMGRRMIGGTGLDFRVVVRVHVSIVEMLLLLGIKQLLHASGRRVKSVIMLVLFRLRRWVVTGHGQHPVLDLVVLTVVCHGISNVVHER